MNILGTTFIFIIAVSVCVGLYLQTSEVQAVLGKSVILPCNGSGFPVEELRVHWEAMGKDVLSVRGDIIRVGRAFEGRVSFLTDPAESEDFSLVLTDVMLNDGDVYECLWEETRPICSVLLHVLKPELIPNHVEATEGEDITLECFGNIPKYKPWEDIHIQWLKDDKEILRLSSGKMDVSIDYNIMTLPPKHNISRGVFSLTIQSVSVFDQGVYKCRYKSIDYEEPRSGFPERHTLTVWAMSSGMTDLMDSFSSASSTSHTHTHTSVPAWTAVASTQTEAGSTTPTHTHTTSAHTEAGSTTPTHTHTTSAHTEAGCTTPTHTHAERAQTEASSAAPTHTHTERAEDISAVPEAGTVSGQRDPLVFLSDETIPWILIGLVTGVLLVTAVILGSLLAFGRI
ncbi:uncharacterized protein LOC143701893 isoform X2 [Siphateles boraxobius]|uniref:uncharacterized protein LOC143701893 isoform X2 n=1 Tax=Siphateles boraxobius TaxID=180520 RepID=UPI004063EA0B